VSAQPSGTNTGNPSIFPTDPGRLAPKADVSVTVDRQQLPYSSGARYTIYGPSFPDWDPDSLHWNAPSNMNINDDGYWFLYAKHLSNYRRTGGVIDSGNTWTALVNVTLYDGPVVNGQCTGNVIFSRDFILTTIDYKVDLYDEQTHGTMPDLGDAARNSQSGLFTRWFR
jgi:hypothetical protein